jgi:hypothetical protein
LPPLTLWKGAAVRTNDYRLQDRLIGEQYRIGGTEFFIHKYLGINQTNASPDSTLTNTALASDPLLVIQDVLNLENRDRKYDPDVISLKGHYAVSDTEFDLRQFGLFLSNETIFVTFHINDMVASLGRTLMSGDVLEVLHRRDDLALGNFSIAKYYVVQEGARPAEGYGPTWWPHLWRVKCDPITDSQEYADILGKPATDLNGDPIANPNGTGDLTLADMLSTYNTEIALNDAVLAQAEAEVPFRNLQSQQFYIPQVSIDNSSTKPVSLMSTSLYGNGLPPNQGQPVQTAITFPTGAPAGTWILRVDYTPPQLYQRIQLPDNTGSVWKRYSIDYRTSWTPANSTLASFINNGNVTSVLDDKSVIKVQQDLRQALKAKVDPDII